MIPEDIPPEPDFLTRFHNRFKDMLQSSNPNFTEFESLVTDFMYTIKTELHFKPNPGGGAVRPPKVIDINNPTEIQKLYRRNRRKALRLIYNDEESSVIWIRRQ